MQIIEIRTLLLVITLVRLSQAVALLYAWRVHRNYPPAREWALGSLLSAVGVLLIGLRGLIPNFGSIVLANAFLLIGSMVFDFGIARAAERSPPWRTGTAFAVAALAVIVWYSLVEEKYLVRVGAFALTEAFYDSCAVYACLRFSGDRRTATFRLVALSLLLLGASGIWRGIDAYLSDLTSVLAAPIAQTQFGLTVIVASVIITSCLILLTAQKLQEELDRQARRDPLTNAFNRRAFDEFADREWSRALRHGSPLCFLMIDIDHFKAFNDRHGHGMGDAALQKVSATAQTVLRPEDIWSRYGGEEFLALLPQTTGDQALAIAERLRATIARTEFETPSERPHLSVSIGVAQNNGADKTWREVADSADRALYRAKASGRNRVILRDAAAMAIEPLKSLC